MRGVSTKPPLRRGHRPRPTVRGAIAGAIVTLGAAVAAWWLWPSGESAGKTPPPRSAQHIKAVTPSKAWKYVEVAKAEKEPPKEKPYWERDNTNGFNEAMIRKWKFVRRKKPSWTNDMAKTQYRLPCEIFESPVENEIATFMTLPLGASIIDMPDYGEEYEKEFKRSCETPIIITEDDDEYRRQLKRDMIQMKIELCERISKGERIGDIMRTTRLEAQRLAQVREDILDAVREEAAATGANGEDPEVLIEAANKMLEKNGIAPIKALGIGKYWLRNQTQERKE